jgi:hypothetical protein
MPSAPTSPSTPERIDHNGWRVPLLIFLLALPLSLDNLYRPRKLFVFPANPLKFATKRAALSDVRSRAPTVFPVRLPATLQPFRRARSGGRAAVELAAGVLAGLPVPHCRSATRRATPGFRSTAGAEMWISARVAIA